MARIDNLNNFLTDVASAIKEKTGVTSITPADFDTAINSISGGATINGSEAQYYVGAGQTINEGDFVSFQTGVASTSNKETYWDIRGVTTDACDYSIILPMGSIEKLIGRKLTWDDDPVEI